MIMDLSTGREVTVDEIVARGRSTRVETPTQTITELRSELAHAEGLIETLVSERDQLEVQLEEARLLLRQARWCQQTLVGVGT